MILLRCLTKMKFKKLIKLEDFKSLKKGDELIVVWNPQGEIWSEEMVEKKIYIILKVQKASTKSEYPDEIILRKKENVFFNFRLFLNGESKVIKEVYSIDKKDNSKCITCLKATATRGKQCENCYEDDLYDCKKDAKRTSPAVKDEQEVSG